MTPEQKQTELNRYKAILLATLDYLDERLSGSFVCDQHDPVKAYHQQQKILIQTLTKQRRLDRLKLKLTTLTKGIQSRGDLAFAPYIKEKTGYDIDIFEDLRKQVAAIITQNEIRSTKELNAISTMLEFYHKTSPYDQVTEKLHALLRNYAGSEKKMTHAGNDGYTEVINREKKGDIEIIDVCVSTGPRPKHFEQQWATAPDAKRKLRIAQWSNGKQASTYVAVEFPTASGEVYHLRGIYPDVRAWWKDNSTIIIDTKKEYTPTIQHRQVRSFADTITIEYIEH